MLSVRGKYSPVANLKRLAMVRGGEDFPGSAQCGTDSIFQDRK
jgi:hypothetical protein